MPYAPTEYEKEQAYFAAEHDRLSRHRRARLRLALARLIAGRKGLGRRSVQPKAIGVERRRRGPV